MCRLEPVERIRANGWNRRYLAVAVDPGAKPLYERLDVQVSIDRDLVAEIRTRSSLFEDEHRKEIYDLEFGMRIP